jgi:putative ubiquitin-RnfH superfamily antitoxin RatB of RatAB toxin-antitoxin module
MNDTPLHIEIVYPLPDEVWQRTLALPRGSTVRDAIVRSGLLQDHPGLSLDDLPVGIFGQSCALDRVLQDADRVEILRPLVFDPMVSRRRRAQHRMQRKNGPARR